MQQKTAFRPCIKTKGKERRAKLRWTTREHPILHQTKQFDTRTSSCVYIIYRQAGASEERIVLSLLSTLSNSSAESLGCFVLAEDLPGQKPGSVLSRRVEPGCGP